MDKYNNCLWPQKRNVGLDFHLPDRREIMVRVLDGLARLPSDAVAVAPSDSAEVESPAAARARRARRVLEQLCAGGREAMSRDTAHSNGIRYAIPPPPRDAVAASAATRANEQHPLPRREPEAEVTAGKMSSHAKQLVARLLEGDLALAEELLGLELEPVRVVRSSILQGAHGADNGELAMLEVVLERSAALRTRILRTLRVAHH